jgi:hypothetical protein
MQFSGDTALFLQEFANCTVTVLMAGAPVANFRGVFDENADPISPFVAERVALKPVLSATTSDIASVSSSHELEIVKDGETQGKRYKFDGKPRFDGSGFTVANLGVAK